MKKNLFLMVVILLLMPFIAACSDGKPQMEAGTLVYGSGDYTAINPALYEHGEINLLLFDGLAAHDADNQIVPALATGWDYDAKNLTYTFYLRQDVKWHDGYDFTAADVKFTLDAIRDPANASEIASNYEEIMLMEVVDKYTFKLMLKVPNAAMLDYLTVGILPQHLLKGKDLATDSFNQHPVGTGPYLLSAWDMGQSITLSKNSAYYGGEPNIDTVIFKIVDDEKARVLQLRSGEIDLAQIAPQDLAQFEGREGFSIYQMTTADYRGIMYNFGSDFFAAHRELPNILSYAIDRQAILDAVLLGKGEVAYSPLQKGAYNYPQMEKFTYDPSRAKAMLEAAGWQLGPDGVYQKDGERCSFTVNVRPGEQVRQDIASIAAQQLADIGVEMQLALTPDIDWAHQEAFLIGWGSPFDPDDHTYKVFASGKGSNYSSYSNAEVDRLLLLARESTDEAKRLQYYRDFQKQLASDLPYTFIVYLDAVYVGNSAISGITQDTVLGHHGVGIFHNIKDWSITVD